MIQSFRKLDLAVNVKDLQVNLVAHPELFGKWTERFANPASPHREVTDIWVRYNDITPFLEGRPMTEFADEHDSIWYDVADMLPEVKDVVYDIMRHVEGERLGGVLITKLAPGGKVYPHTDSGWHAKYYDKFYVPLLNSKGSKFCFDDGDIVAKEGEVYQFNNSYNHWVENESTTDRITMVVCIKTKQTIMKEGE